MSNGLFVVSGGFVALVCSQCFVLEHPRLFLVLVLGSLGVLPDAAWSFFFALNIRAFLARFPLVPPALRLLSHDTLL